MSSPGQSGITDATVPGTADRPCTASQSSSDERLRSLRTQIQDLAFEVNSRKARAGAALGGAVFLILLSAGAAYDLARGNLAPWLWLGLDRRLLTLIAGTTGVLSLLMLVLGLVKLLPESRRGEVRLAELEREYGDLLE